MVTLKPHWNLCLRWLRKAPSARVSGRGRSFFSRVAPTIQFVSTVPGSQGVAEDETLEITEQESRRLLTSERRCSLSVTFPKKSKVTLKEQVGVGKIHLIAN